ncbi:MAG: hypothetical protein FJ087_03325 [Deltaproteobacteria bacterium]|nr:hypothetical protein [Deltaproteobacteria bacterium]
MDARLAARLLLPVFLAGTASCSDGSLVIKRTDVTAPAPGEEEPGDEETSPEDPGVEPDPAAEDTNPPEDPGKDPAKDPAGDPAPEASPTATVRFVTNQEYLALLKDRIFKAKTSIRIAHLEFLDGSLTDDVLALLAQAVDRGVDVRVLLDDNVDENPAAVSKMKAAGIQARLDGGGRTLHVKLVVLDRAVVFVGSTNFSVSSLKYNNEANLLLTDPDVAEAFAGHADSLWASDSGLKGLTGAAVGGIRLIGDGQYVERVLPVIAAAKDRIRIVIYQFDTGSAAGGDLAGALVDAAKSGVDVKVVLEQSSFADNVNDDNTQARKVLEAGGIQVRRETLDVTTHAKLLVADDTVVVYSGNWAYPGLEKNHEAGAIVGGADVVGEAVAFFDSVWSVGQ